MDNLAAQTDMYLEMFVTTNSKHPSTVEVRGPMLNSTHKLHQTFRVSRGHVHLVNISNEYRLHGTEFSSKGIEITAERQVIVYGINREKYSDDGYLALPTDAIGNEYYAVCYAPATRYTLVMVVAANDNTMVSICLANNSQVAVNFSGMSYYGGDWINVTMNKFDTFEINSIGDLTGTYIKSNTSVSVLSGNMKTKVGTGSNLKGSKDHLVEQLLPVRSWGKTFAIVSLPQRTTGEEYRIIASEENTHIQLNGKKNGTRFHQNITVNEPGKYSEMHLPPNTYATVTADKPIQIMQFADTQAKHGEAADPAMITVVPIEQYAADYTFTTPSYSQGDYTNFFIFVIDKSHKAGLKIDGHPLTHAHFTGIPGSNLTTGYLSLPVGTHTVSHSTPDVVFGGTLFGRAKVESYGFPVGLLLAPINDKCHAKPMTPGDEVDNDCDGEVDEEVCDNKGVVFGGYLFGKAEFESYGFPVGLLLEPLNNRCRETKMEPGDKIDNDCDGETDEEVCNNMGTYFYSSCSYFIASVRILL
ncbi:hypothetical protein FSP39_017792 [Pinctada imbricata]|uniref:IgGFc-binding protein N-terminal domain-containing protein n=1 Tax=Pinctada imbricata TaxID=66713 RepID=A0AA88YST2_PINIB|nr:hypothetical protein FSP39_017792 [Pinctada imbricata]